MHGSSPRVALHISAGIVLDSSAPAARPPGPPPRAGSTLHTRTPLFSECPHAFHLDSLPNWSKQRSSRLPRTGHQQQDSRHHALATLLVIVMAHTIAMPSPPTAPLNALAFAPGCTAQRRRSSCLTGGRRCCSCRCATRSCFDLIRVIIVTTSMNMALVGAFQPRNEWLKNALMRGVLGHQVIVTL